MTFPAHHLLVHESCRKLTDISTFTFSNPEKWSDINWLFQKHCWWIYLRHYTICFGCFLPWLLYYRIQNIELFISKDALIYILKRFGVYVQLFRLVDWGWFFDAIILIQAAEDLYKRERRTTPKTSSTPAIKPTLRRSALKPLKRRTRRRTEVLRRKRRSWR